MTIRYSTLVGFLFTVFSLFCSTAFAQEHSDVRDYLEHRDSDALAVLTGIGGELRFKSILGSKIERSYGVEFDILSPQYWKCVSKTDAVAVSAVSNFLGLENKSISTNVHAKDYSFAYNARKTFVEEKFSFRELGYNKPAHSVVRSKFEGAVSAMLQANDIAGNPLSELLTDDKTVLTEKTVQKYDGHAVVCFDYEMLRRTSSNGDKQWLSGTVSWIPDANYMVRTMTCVIKDTTGHQRQLVNRVIDFKTINGKLVPVKCTNSFENGRKHIYVVKDLRVANPDKHFYSAEYIGLETPPRPIPGWVFWSACGVVCLIASIFVFRMRSK